MGDDIGSGLSSMAVCFDFSSTSSVIGTRTSTGFDHPLITQLILYSRIVDCYLVDIHWLSEAFAEDRI